MKDASYQLMGLVIIVVLQEVPIENGIPAEDEIISSQVDEEDSGEFTTSGHLVFQDPLGVAFLGRNVNHNMAVNTLGSMSDTYVRKEGTNQATELDNLTERVSNMESPTSSEPQSENGGKPLENGGKAESQKKAGIKDRLKSLVGKKDRKKCEAEPAQ